MPGTLRIVTDTPMPPLGVAVLLAPDVPGPDIYAFWLNSHRDVNMYEGKRFWRTAVMRECLPSTDDVLDFIALGAPL